MRGSRSFQPEGRIDKTNLSNIERSKSLTRIHAPLDRSVILFHDMSAYGQVQHWQRRPSFRSCFSSAITPRVGRVAIYIKRTRTRVSRISQGSMVAPVES